MNKIKTFLNRLIESLAQAGLQDLDDEEISDAILLASLLKESSLNKSKSPGTRSTKQQTHPSIIQSSPNEKTRDITKSLNIPQSQKNIEPQSSKESIASLYSKEHLSDSGKAGVPFHAPAGVALPNSLQLLRILRPLRRNIFSSDLQMIDEKATAQRIAETGIWLPVMKPKTLRWFELALVIDASVSMQIWTHTISELRRLFEQLGAFRNIRQWMFHLDEQDKKITLLSYESGTMHHCKELINPAMPRLILIISDCVSPTWHEHELFEWINIWGQKHPVGLIQMLPQRLWPQTQLSSDKQVKASIPSPGAANKKLYWHNTSLPWQSEPTEYKYLPLPVTTLESESLKMWTRYITKVRGATVPCFIHKTQDTLFHETPLDGEDERLELFRQVASPDAFRLACYFAATPLRLPIMRLVQQVMLSRSNQTHLAEFFLSGLIKRQSPKDITDEDEIDYEFIGDVRKKLLKYSLQSEALQVQETVSDYIAEHYGSSSYFSAVMAFDSEESTDLPVTGLNYFAKVRRTVLERMGSRYLNLIQDQIEKPQHFESDSNQEWEHLTKTSSEYDTSQIIESPTQPTLEHDIDSNNKKYDTSRIDIKYSYELHNIIDEVSAYMQEADIRIIEKAYIFSARVHQGQARLSGEPYLNHHLAVAYIVSQMRLDVASVVAALLHDTIEDSLTKISDIEKEFGNEVARIVDGFSRISKMNFRSVEEQQAENFRKMILAMSKDLRILLIKLVDRLHNMRTLEYHKRESQIRIAQETIDIYAPLANTLGIQWLQMELEELSLKYLNPDDYLILKATLDSYTKGKDVYLKEVIAEIEAKLTEAGIKAEVKGRIKHIYSVYQKLKRQGIPFEDIYDMLGIRILVATVGECYETMGIIHAMWKPIQHRIKDFIAMPKPNKYQSLHTTVFGPERERIEIQIMTHEMDFIANEGIAALRPYNYSKPQNQEGHELSWLRRLLESQKELKDPHDFLQSLKLDLYPEDVFVFTPRGEVLQFPKGATALDFAYRVHTQLGNQCIGAKINNQIVKLNYELKSGDVIEILRSKKQHPSKDWLRIAKTSMAKTKIQTWLRTQEREQSINIGREIIEEKFKSMYLSTEVDFDKLALDFGYKNTDEFFIAIGFGRLSVNQVMYKIMPEEQKKKEPEKSASKKKGESGIIVKGVEDMLVRFARCCRPIPGDEIVGFITRGKGITVHRLNCRYVAEVDPQRLIAVEWDKGLGESHEIEFSAICEDKPGMIDSMTAIVGEHNISITKLNAYSMPEGTSMCVFRVIVKDLLELEKLFLSLKKLKGIEKIERV